MRGAFHDSSLHTKKHLCVASEFSRFPSRQIRHLRATSKQGFWADDEAGQSSELALCLNGCSNPSLQCIGRRRVILARYSPHQDWWFETDASGTPSGTILELLGDFLARLPQIEFPTGLGLEHDSEFWGGDYRDL